MKEPKITDKEKIKIYEKKGYLVKYYPIKKRFEVMYTLDVLTRQQKLIHSHFLHYNDCCKNCKKKITK